MLSYDSPAPMNATGQTASSALPTAMSSASGNVSTSAVSNGVATIANGHPHKHHHIWLVTGPAGCGKTTVAEHMAKELRMPYIEGDAFHSAANVQKMSDGHALTDEDRWDWLTTLREQSMCQINAGSEGVVVTCSALKRKYRDVIRVAAYYDPQLLIHFIYLDADEAVLLERVSKREGHYMGANMVRSQFTALERPSTDETDVISIDVSRPIDEVNEAAFKCAQRTMDSDR